MPSTNSTVPGSPLLRNAGRLARVSSLTVLLALVALKPTEPARAQKRDAPLKITEIQSRPTANGTVVTLMADAALTRSQTWQDAEGLHVAFPYAGNSPIKRVPRGVKVRRLDRSLEIVVPVRAGSNVTVQPRFNRLNLIVEGGIDTSHRGTDDPIFIEQSAAAEREQESESSSTPAARAPRRGRSASQEAAPVADVRRSATATSATPPLTSSSASAPTVSSPTATRAPAPTADSQPGPVTAAEHPAASTPDSVAAPNQSGQETTTETNIGFFSSVISTTGMVVLLALGIIALFIARLRRSVKETEEGAITERSRIEEERSEQFEEAITSMTSRKKSPPLVRLENGEVREDRRKGQRRKGDRKWWGRRSTDLPISAARVADAITQEFPSHEGRGETRALVQAPAPPPMFGAYRVDQEVGKLVLGQPHRMDVLSSRAPDDRRAVENSLIKALMAPDVDAEARRRVREALEDYGFVARQSAALLMAPNAYERADAARTLGEIEAPASLPFLLEALYDQEPIVRTQAVTSLGALKQPAAIGALLDMARRHPEMPASLLSRVLSACTFDCVELGEGFDLPELELTSGSPDGPFTGEITGLQSAKDIEELPEWLEDEHLSDALARLDSADVEARKAAARNLAQFQVQRSVSALSQMAANDSEASVRAAAVASLGEINHESVFAAVLIAFTDEAREVRAAAARSLSRLSFDRADAYVRLMQSASPETLGIVARACIKGGIAAQAVDRLCSQDRRQAYESFSLLSLLAKSNENEPLLEAIVSHRDYDVRLAAVRLLGVAGQPAVVQDLRHLAVKDGLPEKLRTALLEVVYKIDQALPV